MSISEAQFAQMTKGTIHEGKYGPAPEPAPEPVSETEKLAGAVNRHAGGIAFIAAVWRFPLIGLFIMYLPLILFMVGASIIHSFLPGLHMKWSVLIMSGILMAWVVWVVFFRKSNR